MKRKKSARVLKQELEMNESQQMGYEMEMSFDSSRFTPPKEKTNPSVA